MSSAIARVKSSGALKGLHARTGSSRLWRSLGAQVDKLTPSLIARAVCGHLVFHDPTDEPGSELPDRIYETLSSNNP